MLNLIAAHLVKKIKGNPSSCDVCMVGPNVWTTKREK